MKVRLQKYLADRGVASRRKSEEFIAKGLVKVNGETVTEMGVKVDPDKDLVEVNRKGLKKHRDNLIYYKINKPAGYVCSAKGGDSVLKLIDTDKRLFTVGRLDKESEGLLILTNDGRLTYKLTHPKFEKEKEYEVTVDKPIPDTALKKLESGLKIMGKKTAPAKTIRISKRKFSIILKEGMNRQIRRMCRKVGFRVHKLKRIRVGDIRLEELEPGEYEKINHLF